MLAYEQGDAVMDWLIAAFGLVERVRILSDIEDGPPGRRYRAEDPEGQRWFFIQRAA